ncbi:CPLD5 [Auxenochlorella protothecoides x Auxenochlorella symbiontica]
MTGPWGRVAKAAMSRPTPCGSFAGSRHVQGQMASHYYTLGIVPSSPMVHHAARNQSAVPRGGLVLRAQRGGNPQVADRVVSSLPYLIPLFDGLRYGKFIFVQYPAVQYVLAPLQPLISLYFGFPFASLVVFFGVYAGIINNQSFSRFVRLNALQAVLLSVILILPGLLESVFLQSPPRGTALQIYIQLSNAIWLFTSVCVAYGIGASLAGRVAQLPFVSSAAEAQVR